MTGFALRLLVSAALICAQGVLTGVSAQDADTVVRLNQVEQQMRQLTGAIEQLQYRNQQLEQALRRMQEDVEFRFQQGGKGAAGATQGRPAGVPTQSSTGGSPQTSVSGRRSDAFDPSLNPHAPGVPRTLGNITGSAPPQLNSAETAAPLDLSTQSGSARGDARVSPGDTTAADNVLPAPSSRNTSGTDAQAAAVLPPSQSPRDEYDLAYGYLLRKDYASAEDSFRTFLRTYPGDRMAADAQFWLGESMFQRQSYRDAADVFLNVTKNYENSAKAPDALLRLGQSLAAIGEKELACATFGEVGRKYPRASLSVKQGVDREQKRVHC